ncbi:hypothetical protein C8R44DRAFT_770316 [Mycena epipterygia]|nr:hypothetical protein C8R44DRAFT_770316 [Mycena epipterygia]
MARIKRILRDCQRLGPDIDFNQIVLFRDHVQQVEGLMESCKRLEYLLRGGVSSQTQRDTIENLLKTIKMSPVLDDIGLQILRGLEGFTELYFRFCESALMGEDTETTILELRELVKGELDRANERIKDFNALSKHYAEKRHDLTVLMQESTKSAEKDGFREGVSSDVESQQIYDELGKIDKLIKQIGETLKHTKDFWKDVDQSLRSASSVRANQQAKDPPDGITSGPGELGLERRAEKIQTGLNTVCQAAQQYCSSKKMLKTGNDLVEDAACLTTKCTAIVRVQTSVVSQLHTQSFDLKSTRKSIPPLTKALRSAVKGYQKLSLQFEKYAQKIYLLFWFAGTTAEEKLGVERSAHWEFAREYLQSKELSPCVLSFESAFYGIERQLRETQSFWMTVGGWTSTL